MKKMISYCGYRCDLCSAYRKNINSKADQRDASKGLSKYYGLNIPTEEIYCYGCLNQNKDLRIIDKSCSISLCVLEQGLDNCLVCDDVCKRLEERFINYQKVKDSLSDTSKDDYQKFIKPYEMKKRYSK